MRKAGDVIQWNNKGGYGFVRDAAGRDYYIHISKVQQGTRPHVGDSVSFETAKGRNGRPSAVDVIITASKPVAQPSLRDIRHGSSTVSRYKLGLRTTAATVLTLLILLAIGSGHAPAWLGLVYAGMGTASALLYRFDKLYALHDKYRVSESNLHVVDLCFGIIGGLAGQEVYRHKTVKPRFVATTWAIALTHVLGLAALAFGWLDLLLS